MQGWKVFMRLVRREMKLWQLGRELKKKQKIRLSARLLVRHPDEFGNKY
jgi:hypothetical protein